MGVALLAATGSAQRPFMGQCTYLGDPLSPLPGCLLYLFPSISSLSPHSTPQFSLATRTPTLHGLLVKVLKSLERELVRCQLAKGRVDR